MRKLVYYDNSSLVPKTLMGKSIPRNMGDYISYINDNIHMYRTYDVKGSLTDPEYGAILHNINTVYKECAKVHLENDTTGYYIINIPRNSEKRIDSLISKDSFVVARNFYSLKNVMGNIYVQDTNISKSMNIDHLDLYYVSNGTNFLLYRGNYGYFIMFNDFNMREDVLKFVEL